jgi:hypothetical protein
MVERFGNRHGQGLAGIGGGRLQFPVAHVRLHIIGRAGAERLADLRRERVALGVGPVARDDEGVGLAFLEDGTEHLARLQPALDPAGIEEEREALAGLIPQFLVQFEERPLDDLALVVQQANAVVDLPATHRSGEVQIELELVLRQPVARRVNVDE